MKYKKIYIEITNACNLNCKFCAKTKRSISFMNKNNFIRILDQIKPYTDYIYLHVMGEPLLHPEINDFLSIAYDKGFHVNITTNGFLLHKLNEKFPIRQINISLHACKEQNKVGVFEYLNNVFSWCEKESKKGTYINYRIWRKNCSDIRKALEARYQIKINPSLKTKTLSKNIFYSQESEFLWPETRLGEGNSASYGTCRALKDHIAILVDGTVVPCCLDNNASIALGNILKESLKDIMTNPLFNALENGFKKNKKIHPLCQKCTFYEQKLK